MAVQQALNTQGKSAQMNLIASGFFKAIIDKCEGCDRVIEANDSRYCTTYANPESKWRNGICNFATHAKLELETAKTKVNPLKASKRAMTKKAR